MSGFKSDGRNAVWSSQSAKLDVVAEEVNRGNPAKGPGTSASAAVAQELQMSRRKASKTKLKTKLKTMNEISAADAVKLFDAAIVFDNEPGRYRLKPEHFPINIAGKDYLEGMTFYLDLLILSRTYANPGPQASSVDERLHEERHELPNAVASVPEANLEELVSQLGPPQRKVFDRIVDGFHPRLKDLVNDETLISDETGRKMAEGTIKIHVSELLKIFGVANRKALFAKAKPVPPC